ncbi:MAG: cysteine desulfurase family protein [Planctomycetota bacterium]|nr:cysteine desulfurase family protein [Planctomycetota bacterium]
MDSPRIYLDHVAAAPLDPEARRVMVELMTEPQANPSSPHEEGRAAKDQLEAARTRIAKTLGCRPREVLFTSGATEGSNLAVLGLAHAGAARSKRVVVSAMEHPAVLDSARALEADGFELVIVPPDETGHVSADRFLDAVGDDAAFAALILANHEMGAVMPVTEVGTALRARGIPFLCDASLGPGRLPCTPAELNADVIVFEGPTIGGPLGTGCVYVRRGTKIAPTVHGGIQEERLRPGSPSVAGLAGMAVALERAIAEGPERATRYAARIAAFVDEIRDAPGVRPLTASEKRLPGLVTIELGGIEGEAVMINMDLAGIAVATGSTCALGGSDPSPSLLAMGFNVARAASTIRVSVGEGVDDNSMKRAASTLCRIVERLRSLHRR